MTSKAVENKIIYNTLEYHKILGAWNKCNIRGSLSLLFMILKISIV